MKIKMTAAVLAMLMIFSLNACSDKEKEEDTIEIAQESATPSAAQEEAKQTPIPDYNPSSELLGLLMPFDLGEYSLAAAHGFLQQAETLGYPAKLYRLEDTNQESIDQKVNEMIEDDCAGALVWASNNELIQATQTLRNAGMKVVVPYYNVGDIKVDANLLADPKDYGSEAARIMCEEILKRGHSNGVIAISGTLFEPQLAQAFEETITKDYPQFRVEQVNNAVSPEAIEEYVLNTPDIRGALALPAGTAIEWENACKAVQKKLKPTPTPEASPSDATENGGESSATPKPSLSPTPTPSEDTSYKRNVVILALDYSESNLDAVNSGLVFGLIGRPYYDSTAQSTAVLARLLRVLPTQTDAVLNAPIVRRSGISKYITLRKEYISWFKGSEDWFPQPSATPEPSVEPTQEPTPEPASPSDASASDANSATASSSDTVPDAAASASNADESSDTTETTQEPEQSGDANVV